MTDETRYFVHCALARSVDDLYSDPYGYLDGELGELAGELARLRDVATEVGLVFDDLVEEVVPEVQQARIRRLLEGRKSL